MNMPKRSMMKCPEGKVPRGRMIRLYPTLEQKQHMRLVQDEARHAWNVLVNEYNAAVKAQFEKAERDGAIGPRPAKPESDAGREAWSEYYKTLGERRKIARTHGKDLQMALPRSDKASYERLMKAWDEFGAASGRPYKRRMTANMYQALLQDFASSMIPKKGAARWRPPRLRKDSDDMPIRTGSGVCVKPSGEKKRNALVQLPGLGWILGICHRDLNLMVKGSMVEGVAFREQTDGWYAAVRVYVPKPEPTIPTEEIVGVDINLDYLAVCSDGKKWINPRSQVVDVALPKEGPMPKIKRMPLTGFGSRVYVEHGGHCPKCDPFGDSFQCVCDARIDNKWRESPERAHTRRARHVGQIIDMVVHHLEKYRTVVIEREAPKVELPKGAKQDAYAMAMGRLHTALRNRLGDRVALVDADFTSQECSRCGHRDKSAWTRRTGDGMHAMACKCPACGNVDDRDVNAARNLVRKHLNSPLPS
jgi:transposase